MGGGRGGRERADHVILGTGAIGRALVDALIARGVDPSQIRVVNRSGIADVPALVHQAAGDVADPDVAVGLTSGARVVYQVLGLPYQRWISDFPALQIGAIAGAQAAGARLVTLENVYGYGTPERDGDRVLPFTEDSPMRPVSRKGTVRARMHADLMAAHTAGRIEVAVGRASDYFGPGSGAQATNFGDQAMRAAHTGGAVQVIGDPDQPHTYSFIPDIAAGLVALGEHPEAAGGVWHLPNDPATRTLRQLLEKAFALTGHGAPRLRPVPRAVLRLVGLIQPPARELIEMLYEFQQPFVVDSTKITERLGVAATPLDQAIEQTLASTRT